MKKLAIALLTLCPNLLFANSACDTPKDAFDDFYCSNKVYLEADKELNGRYTKLKNMLDSNGKKLLKESQVSWLEDRNSNCSRHIEEFFFVSIGCAKEITVERSNFIQDRIRECSSSGCQNSKL
ncbi:MAG: DUF1311 domain-containing protein [Candidatus Thiothrix singaporensis]|uniref:DUF1311 domain-containing protein n=1 Tax=Candidatus Thiothrix singaporensis TaxID=2799669 RepID=A0A7L6AR12_9GAMM|nr:MAG: DUF1311 domain-containing protein [Candidatus Thiothrix singaporensis]